MVDVDAVMNELMSGRDRRTQRRHAERLGTGLIHLDYDDPDRAFLVTVAEVSRHRLLVEPRELGLLQEVAVTLADVFVDNRVSLVLEGRPSGPSEQAGSPIAWPAERLMQVGVQLSDDVGTVYTAWTAEAGGEDTPWRAVRRFRPAPPDEARELRLLTTLGATAMWTFLTLP